MKPSYVDLHIHSTASDGTCPPARIVTLAKREGVAACALTDHDTLSGLDEAEGEAARQGILFVRGCEISTIGPWGSMHILGLWLPKEKDKLAGLEAALQDERANREKRNIIMAERLRGLGIDIEYDDVARLAGSGVVGRPHFAQLLAQKKYVSNEREAFAKYVGRGCPAYVEREQMTPEQGVALLKRTGALVSLAHPGLLKGCTHDELQKMIMVLKDHGLDAIEVFHSSHGPEDVRFFTKIAKTYGLAVTGGSDFHGEHKPNIRIGHVLKGSRSEHRIGFDVFEKLEDYRQTSSVA